MSALVAFSRELARWLHRDQVDKQGKPYFEHVSRVAARLSDQPDILQAAGYLHDVIEDCGMTINVLAKLGIPREVIHLVVMLSRSENDESYTDYIDRLLWDRFACLVKLADLQDNCDPRRGFAPGTEGLLVRYQKAQKRILEAWPDLADCLREKEAQP